MEKDLMFSPDRAAKTKSRSAAGSSRETMARAEAFALMQTLNAELLAAQTVTATLEQWCARHGLAGDPAVRAKRIDGRDKPAFMEQRERLRVGPNEPIIYRRVDLACGERVLTEAEIWYVPSRLNAAIRNMLEQSDTPFGRAVMDLDPVRETFLVEILWRPGEGSQEPEGAIPRRLFQHRALVFGPDRQPLAEVNETYTAEILAFGASEAPLPRAHDKSIA
jgi:chorismate-pyruvate lyase